MLVAASCSSASDDDTAATTSVATDLASTPTQAPAPTTSDEPAQTSEPATTKAPAPTTTDAPTTTATSVPAPTTTQAPQPIILTGTVTDIVFTVGPPQTDGTGSTFSGEWEFAGDLVGTVTYIGTFEPPNAQGDTRSIAYNEFTGTIVGLGEGTLTFDEVGLTTPDAQYTSTGDVLRGSGAFAGMHGKVAFEPGTYRFELIADTSAGAPDPTSGDLLVAGLNGSFGGTIGPDGALYVPEGMHGQITRIDPGTGEASIFASGLPPAEFGGVVDVAFIGPTAYALVTLVSADAGATADDVVGIYRVDGAETFTVIADLGTFSIENPPDPSIAIDVPSGLQFALQSFGDGFLVTDGHHNRVLHATLQGVVTELISFGNTVPTGLTIEGTTVYMGEAGPIPHDPETGRVVSFPATAPTEATVVAAGASLIVDVEVGPGGNLYAVSQGDSPGDVAPASPARPNSGKLLQVNEDGSFTVIVDRLDVPTSLDFVGDTAFVVTLDGAVWRIENVSTL